MCDPASLAIASAAVSAVGSIGTGISNKKASDYQAQVEQQNATIAQNNANQELAIGKEQERRQRLKTAQIAGEQKTAIAANNLIVNSGTALDTQADTAYMGEMDALMIRYDAQRRADAYKQQSLNLQSQSQMTSLAGKNALTSSYLGAGASLLGGVAKANTKWNYYTR